MQKNFYSVLNFGLYGFVSLLIANLVIISRLKHLKAALYMDFDDNKFNRHIEIKTNFYLFGLFWSNSIDF